MRLLLLPVFYLPAAVLAEPWTFSDPVTVAGGAIAPHYHHLDGAGRRHVAASDAEVAVVWEDDRSGAPQAYLAVKPRPAESFSRSFQLSDGEEAYAPVIALLGEGQWLAAWEQDGAVVASIVDAEGPGPRVRLAATGSRQVTLASDGAGRVAAIWARERGGGQLVEAAQLQIKDRTVKLAGAPVPVAPVEHRPRQSHPAAVWGSEGRLVVAWEDRRAGHTRLLHSGGTAGQGFDPERQLNEYFEPAGRGRTHGGLGSGVMRVALAADAATVQAVWLDKRNPNSGYAVWGAVSTDGGRTFGPNQIVQDDLGAAVPQWHAAVAGGRTGFVAAWDDAREGWDGADEPGDVLVSWKRGESWSPDLVVPGASGEGYQGSPAVALDPRGELHLVWIDRPDLSSPTRLRYLRGALSEP
jgi:hypothetical protein